MQSRLQKHLVLLIFLFSRTTKIEFFLLFPGVMPYPGLTGMEVVDFLKSGQRLKQPDGCPDEL